MDQLWRPILSYLETRSLGVDALRPEALWPWLELAADACRLALASAAEDCVDLPFWGGFAKVLAQKEPTVGVGPYLLIATAFLQRHPTDFRLRVAPRLLPLLLPQIPVWLQSREAVVASWATRLLGELGNSAQASRLATDAAAAAALWEATDGAWSNAVRTLMQRLHEAGASDRSRMLVLDTLARLACAAPSVVDPWRILTIAVDRRTLLHSAADVLFWRFAASQLALPEASAQGMLPVLLVHHSCFSSRLRVVVTSQGRGILGGAQRLVGFRG
jgi:hypothetical protein